MQRMSLNRLPPEVLYDIIGHVVADYIDVAITSPPQPSYLTKFSPKMIDTARELFSELRIATGVPHPIVNGSDRTEWSDATPAKWLIIQEKLIRRMKGRKDDLEFDLTPEALTRVKNATSVILDSDDEHGNSDDESDWEDTDDEGTDEDVEEGSDLESIDTDFETESRQSDNWHDDHSDPLYDDEESAVLFKEWEYNEDAERLPKSAIQPLLAVNGRIRELTLSVVFHALGIKPKKKAKNIYGRIKAVLRDLRKRYRLACTEHFSMSDLGGDYDGPETPLINAYISLFTMNYCLRHLVFSGLKVGANPTDEDSIASFSELVKMMKSARYLPLSIPQLSLRTRIAQRSWIIHVRYRRFALCMTYTTRIRTAFIEAFDTTTGPNGRIGFVFNESKCRVLRDIVHAFFLFDEKWIDKQTYAELPQCLIKAIPIRDILSKICGFRFIHEAREVEDMLAAARECGELLQRWRRRSAECKTMYVVLSNPAAVA